MKHRIFGSTGVKVSEVGFGAWAIGGVGWGPVNDDESVRALKRALDLGVNFFDTADVYGRGHSEKIVGRALKEHRKEVFIATKVGNDFYAGGSEGKWPKNFSESYIKTAIDRSLQRLQTDYVDLYQLHNPPEDILRKGEVFNFLEDLKSAGKIRFYGVSVTTPSEGVLALNQRGVSSIQVVYNMLEQEAAEVLLPAAKKRNVAIIARVPLASGFLSGKYTASSAFPEGDRRKTWPAERIAEYIAKVEKLRFVTNSNRSMAQAALKFVLASDAVSTVIPGCKNDRQVEENVAASQADSLSREELTKVQELCAKGFN